MQQLKDFNAIRSKSEEGFDLRREVNRYLDRALCKLPRRAVQHTVNKRVRKYQRTLELLGQAIKYIKRCDEENAELREMIDKMTMVIADAMKNDVIITDEPLIIPKDPEDTVPSLVPPKTPTISDDESSGN